jgi:hypothetical protein
MGETSRMIFTPPHSPQFGAGEIKIVGRIGNG